MKEDDDDDESGCVVMMKVDERARVRCWLNGCWSSRLCWPRDG